MTPENVLALVEALETKGAEAEWMRKRIEELAKAREESEEQRVKWFQMAQELGEKLDAADKRNAELVEALEKAQSERDKYRARLTVAKAFVDNADSRIAALESRTVTVKLPALNDDLIDILGRPNFMCAHLAELLRKSGEEIKRKSEHEQAAIIHWFLGIYLEHGDKWEGVAKADIQARAAGIQVIEGEGL